MDVPTEHEDAELLLSFFLANMTQEGEEADLHGTPVQVLPYRKRGRDDIAAAADGIVQSIDVQKRQAVVHMLDDGRVEVVDAAALRVDFSRDLSHDLLYKLLSILRFPLTTMASFSKISKAMSIKMADDRIWEGALRVHYRNVFIHFCSNTGHVHPIVAAMLDTLTRNPLKRGSKYAKRFFEFIAKTKFPRMEPFRFEPDHSHALVESLKWNSYTTATLGIDTSGGMLHFKYLKCVWQCDQSIFLLFSAKIGVPNQPIGEAVIHCALGQDIFAAARGRRNVLPKRCTVQLVAHDQYGYVLWFTLASGPVQAGYAYFTWYESPVDIARHYLEGVAPPADTVNFADQGVVLCPNAIAVRNCVWARDAKGFLLAKTRKQFDPDCVARFAATHNTIFFATTPDQPHGIVRRVQVLEHTIYTQVYISPDYWKRLERFEVQKPQYLPIIHHVTADQNVVRVLPYLYIMRRGGQQLAHHLFRAELYRLPPGQRPLDLVSSCLVCGGVPTICEVESGKPFCNDECHEVYFTETLHEKSAQTK